MNFRHITPDNDKIWFSICYGGMFSIILALHLSKVFPLFSSTVVSSFINLIAVHIVSFGILFTPIGLLSFLGCLGILSPAVKHLRETIPNLLFAFILSVIFNGASFAVAFMINTSYSKEVAWILWLLWSFFVFYFGTNVPKVFFPEKNVIDS